MATEFKDNVTFHGVSFTGCNSAVGNAAAVRWVGKSFAALGLNVSAMRTMDFYNWVDADGNGLSTNVLPFLIHELMQKGIL